MDQQRGSHHLSFDYLRALAALLCSPTAGQDIRKRWMTVEQGRSPLNKLTQACKVLWLVVTLNLGVITLDIKHLWDDFQLASMKLSTSHLISLGNSYLTETAIVQHWVAHIGPHFNPITLFWLKTVDHNSRNYISACFNGKVNSPVRHFSTCISQIRPFKF